MRFSSLLEKEILLFSSEKKRRKIMQEKKKKTLHILEFSWLCRISLQALYVRPSYFMAWYEIIQYYRTIEKNR